MKQKHSAASYVAPHNQTVYDLLTRPDLHAEVARMREVVKLLRQPDFYRYSVHILHSALMAFTEIGGTKSEYTPMVAKYLTAVQVIMQADQALHLKARLRQELPYQDFRDHWPARVDLKHAYLLQKFVRKFREAKWFNIMDRFLADSMAGSPMDKDGQTRQGLIFHIQEIRDCITCIVRVFGPALQQPK